MRYVFDEFVLDARRCELSRAGDRLHLEPQVYTVLCYLLENRDRLVPRDELLDAVWGHRFVAPATLSSRIKALRRALSDDGAEQRLIRTVRGRGFRFVAPVTAGPADGGAQQASAPRIAWNRRKTDQAGPAPPVAPPPPTPSQQIRFCRSADGVRLAYATSGTGPPLVKTATWLTHLEFDWLSPVWRHWMTELSRDHTFVRYDERGCGLSDRDPRDLSLDAFVADLEAVVESLGLDRFTLFGMSQGGPVAVAYAARHPERVEKLVLFGSFARGRPRHPTAEQQLREEVFVRMLPLGWGHDNPAFRQFFAKLFLPEGTPEQISWFSDLQRRTTSAATAARLISEIFAMDVTDEAARVTAPTLVFHADEDAVIPFESGRHLSSLISHSRFVPLRSRNHLLLEDEPAWEVFRNELREFHDSVDPLPFLAQPG